MSRIMNLLKNAQKTITDNAPVILTAVAVTGVVSTTVLAVRATPQATIDIMHAESEKAGSGEDGRLTPVEKVQLCWKYYIPTVAVGGATIACILGANTISTKRQAALMSLYTITERTFADYKDKVVEQLGETKEKRIRDDIAQDRINEDQPVSSQILLTGKGDVLCKDAYSGRYFRSTMETLRRAENEINHQLVHDNYASQNDFNRWIGLTPNKYGEEIGWSSKRLLELDISGGVTEDGEPCLVVDYRVQPKRGYYKFDG